MNDSGDTGATTARWEVSRASSPALDSHLGTATFPSVDALVTTEVDSTRLDDRVTVDV